MYIFHFLLHVLKKAKVAPAIITTIIVIFALAYMIFQQSILIQSDLEVYSTIIALGWYTTIERFLKAVNELIVAYFIMLPFKLTAEQCLSDAIVSRSPSSLLRMKENAYALKTAALRALQSLVENGLSVITPIVLLISRSAALGMRIDIMQLLIVMVCLAALFLVGSAILAYDHRMKKTLSKKETIVEEQARSLMSSIATISINGMAAILPNWLTQLKREVTIPTTKHEVIMSIMYGALEIATTGIPIYLVWVFKGKDAFLPLYIVIQPMFWNTWYLFWTVKSLVVSTAPWAQFAEFIVNSKPPSSNLPEPENPGEMINVFTDSSLSEIILVGPSGCGKTTLMRNIITEICDKFTLGFIMYIDQFACLPLKQEIYEYFISSFPSPADIPANFEDTLFILSEQLGISNVINKNTLHQSFSNPSGGEKKRIIFLKYVFPILMGFSKVMIAFLDEVSAGLDTDSFAKVRIIIEELKTQGVKIVSIDHHEHHGKNSLKVEVFKEVREIHHEPSVQKGLSFWQTMIANFFPYVYRQDGKEDSDLENGEKETTIVVWAPLLST